MALSLDDRDTVNRPRLFVGDLQNVSGDVLQHGLGPPFSLERRSEGFARLV
jgi:hypothetical protein